MPDDAANPLRVVLDGVEEEVKLEAVKILGDLGNWAASEVARATSASDHQLSYPSGGGTLASMTLDEALARAEALDDDLSADLKLKRERRKRAGDIAGSILTTALRIIVTGGIATL